MTTNNRALAILAREQAGRKICTRCRLELPLSAFNRYLKRGVKRPFRHCRACQSKHHLELRKTGYFKAKDARHRKQRDTNHPEKQAATAAVANALSSGRLVRPSTCQQCGQTPKPFPSGKASIEAHHDDYSKLLEVRWLCHPCHMSYHRLLSANGGGRG